MRNETTDLEATSAIAQLLPAEGPAAGVSSLISQVFPMGQVRLQLSARWPGAAQAVQHLLGGELPLVPNRSASINSGRAIWQGVGDWLLTCPFKDVLSLCEALRAELAGNTHAVTDVSAQTVLRLHGPGARKLLATGGSAKANSASFTGSHSLQAKIGKARVLIDCVDGASSEFHLYVRPSFAPYLVSWLLDGAASQAAEDMDQ